MSFVYPCFIKHWPDSCMQYKSSSNKCLTCALYRYETNCSVLYDLSCYNWFVCGVYMDLSSLELKTETDWNDISKYPYDNQQTRIFAAELSVLIWQRQETKSPMASRLSHSPQSKGAALISVPRPWASSEPTLQPSS